MMTYVVVRDAVGRGGSGVQLNALDTLLSMFGAVHGEKVRTGEHTSLIDLPAGDCDVRGLIRDVFGRMPPVGASGPAEAERRGRDQAELLLEACGGDVHEARRRLPGSALEYWLDDMCISYDRVVSP